MTLDLSFDDGQRVLVDALTRFCADHCSDEAVKALVGQFPRALWNGVAELGVLALATPEGEGGAMELVAACEALGAAAFPGPLVQSFFATQVLDPDDRIAVAGGRLVVSVGSPPLLPWAPMADRFIVIEQGSAWLAEPVGEVAPVETLGGEPWGRVALEPRRELGEARGALVIHGIALAAFVAAAGRELVSRTAEHARTRKQFGRSIGEFQAVAHPLADCEMRLAASATLAREAAFRFDAGDPSSASGSSAAAVARLSATAAAVEAAHVCHQLFGALGIALEGPVFHLSRRIRQLASQPPDDRDARATVLADFGL